MSNHEEFGNSHDDGQEMPTTRIDITEFDSFSQPSDPAQPLPPAIAPTPAAAAHADGTSSSRAAQPRKRWPVVVSIVAVCALILGGIGGFVYANNHTKALNRCRASVAAFSEQRKQLLDTMDQTPKLQQLIQQVLGVDEILDAAAKAANAAEGTVDQQGCATNATITQLNLVADTLDSATDSLQSSLATMKKPISDSTAEGLLDWLGLSGNANGSDSNTNGSDQSKDSNSDSGNSGNNENNENNESQVNRDKQQLSESIEQGRSLLERLRSSYEDSAAAQRFSDGLQAALDTAEQLVNESGVKDSRLYKAAKVTLDEIIKAVNDWIDQQAAKAQ
ncbi:M-like protein Szp3 [Bifidobacterium gallicum DSM 20093 = LMG 11596]|nr:M-like protein Szp3 [Bifidobacterium gallicum DSM 20093 = LMG 11596]